ncbi:MAG: cytidyltransferase-like protein [Parasphingorhabdus sp.]|jgi:cytidyltransferase-like protein
MSKPVRVYCVITADLFHFGHVRFLKAALAYGDQLIVGLCSDRDVERYKRKPILTLAERTEVVTACKYVHQLIPSAPPDVNHE